jgi:Bacterial Ig domain/Immunoglobulin I-set domain
VTAGQTATFSVTATGTAPLSYQWSKNGTAIAGATAASYTTPATANTDNGAQFVVVVSNTAGSKTSNAATLTVSAGAVAPSITTQPASQTVTAGQTATFSVTATGTAPLSYQWSKNGTAIAGATAASYTTPATANTDNGAQFVVVVSNTAGSKTSNAATLTVSSQGGGGGLPSGLGWFQIPNTTYQSVCPSYSDIQGQSGCPAVVNAWGSGWADTKRNRMVLFGGGHTDYFGNEVYILDLNANPITLTLGKDATHGSALKASSCAEVNGDGTPGSRHDNDGMAYLAKEDAYFIHGGNLANCGSFTNGYWTLNPTTMAWTRPSVPSTAPNPGQNGSSSTLDYDPVNDKVYLVETNANTFWQWDPGTNVWSALNGNINGACDTHGYEHTSIIDPVRRLYFCFGVGDANKISLNAPYAVSTISAKNCGTIASDTGPGLAYDSSQGLIVMWSGGNTVYLYNPDTDSCTSKTYTGGPPSQQGSGTYKRFSYFPSLGVFIVINDASQNVWGLRLTAQSGTGSGPNISGVSATAITTVAATIIWTTDVTATSQVEYGTTTAYGTLTTLNASLLTSHTVALAGLTANTLYHYRVHSKNSSGVESISGDFAFQTNNTTDTTPPTVSITAPATGATVSGSATLTASASDNVGVTSVQFLLDGANLGSALTASPYTMSWDTTTASNGTHSLTAQARDAAGNVGTSTAVSVTVSNTTGTTTQNFQQRCAAAGVLVCEGFDTSASFTQPASGSMSGMNYGGSSSDCPAFPTKCIQQDTGVSLSGGSSMRYDFYSGVGQDGQDYYYHRFGCAVGATCTSPTTFGQNSTFYVQFAFRADQNWVNTNWNNVGSGGTAPKLIILHPSDATSGQPATCDPIQTVIRMDGRVSQPTAYTACSPGTNLYTGSDGATFLDSSGSLLQQGFTAPAPFTGYDCAYNGGSAPVGPNCFAFQANTWYTIYMKVHVGTWGANNSTVEEWVAPYGQQLKKWINAINGFQFSNAGSAGTGFNAVTLTQYMTGSNGSYSCTAGSTCAHVWYDELIVSSQPIPAPAGQTP